MTILKSTLGLAALCVLASARSALAEPLDPAHVPADAKWVLHFDFDELRATTYAEIIRRQHPKMIEGARQFLQKRYGIDPRGDLHGATMFGSTYRAHTGTLILVADYDLDKVSARIEKEKDVKTESWQGHTFYFLGSKGREDRSAVIVLLDGKRAVFSSAPEGAKAALDLIAGRAPSLDGKRSELITQIPQGSAIYGAAIDLQEIRQHEGGFPILRQHERIVYATGENDDQVFETVTLVAQSEEVAQDMQTALRGLIAGFKLWAADSEALSQVTEDVEITREGRTVTSHYRGDAQDVAAATEEFLQRVQQWRRAFSH